ncbi:MAG TPA: HlyD family type I secretion periplasmic adaptor subunit [Burkholderiaceae bacterium]|nr:HlyD family type I secretion periplasmic adaptor subunit [Burkholderiaceae bacterium]
MSTPIVAREGALADLLSAPLLERAQRRAWQRTWQRRWHALWWPLGVTAVLLAAWAATAPLAGAVVAPAQLKVQTKRKTVQHQEGGIVREILVRDGQRVRAGDALLVIGDLRQDAELNLLQDQWRAARVRAARAEAESQLSARFDVPDDLRRNPAAAEHVAREAAVFNTRRRALDEQSALLQRQIEQVQAQVAALESQIDATSVSNRLSKEELALNEELAHQGFVHRARLITLQRTAADYQSRLGEVGSELALARQRIAELRSRQAQLRLSYQTQGTDDWKDAAARVREFDERLRPSKDQTERQTVRAPVDGEVMSLRVSAPGAVIAPREALLDLVPQHDKLVVDARIAPPDIEQMHIGGAAEVRLISGDARRTPLLPATVTFVSADRVTAPDGGASWFDVTVEVDTQALTEQQRALRMQAGMPAELYVSTGERTLLQYLLKPLRTFSQRAMREAG